MQSPNTENLTIHNRLLSSRRKFLTNLACGSLLFLAGSNVASARAKHFAARKSVQKHTSKVSNLASEKHHQKLKSVLSNRLAKKSEHHRVHEQLAAHHSHGKYHGHSKHSRIQLASHRPTRSRMYNDDALVVLDTHEERQYFARKNSIKNDFFAKSAYRRSFAFDVF